jgi:hypothetical protein
VKQKGEEQQEATLPLCVVVDGYNRHNNYNVRSIVVVVGNVCRISAWLAATFQTG